MAKTEGQLTNNVTREGSRIAIQAGGSFVIADVTGTPQTSPLSYTTWVYTIVVPDNAIEFICSPTTDLRVSDTVGVATYDIVRASTKESIPCAKMQNIYVQREDRKSTRLNS